MNEHLEPLDEAFGWVAEMGTERTMRRDKSIAIHSIGGPSQSLRGERFGTMRSIKFVCVQNRDF